ncbi:MAG: DUF4347 domain-containing protein, partial [Acidiferrobacterales bacterium]|nr:DUF4347 domain-containing protein [Acidiferrobacterales bacterium]
MFDAAAGAVIGDELLDPEVNGAEETLPIPPTESTVETQQSASASSADTGESDSPSTDAAVALEESSETSEQTEDDMEIAEGGESSDKVDTSETAEDDPVVAEPNNEETSESTDTIESDDVEGEQTTSSPHSGTDTDEDVENVHVAAPDQSSASSDQTDTPEAEEEPQQYAALSQNDDYAPDDVEEVVFIDTAVDDYEQLLQGILSSIEDDIDETSGDSLTAVEPEEEETLESLLSAITYDDAPSLTESETNLDEEEASDDDDDEQPNQIYINGTLIVLLQQDQSAIEQISETLAGLNDLGGVHLVSHGAVGQIRVGNETIGVDNLAEYSEVIAQWGEALSENGDILLYGCNVGESGDGQQFIDAFAALTKADIAASDDATGNVESGGDWELEIHEGEIESEELLNAANAASFVGVLAPGDADTDEDGIDDVDDLDDDNDGILDSEEGLSTSPVTFTNTLAGSTTNGVTVSTTYFENATGVNQANYVDNSNFTFADPSITSLPATTMQFSNFEIVNGADPLTFNFSGADVDQVYLHMNSVDQFRLDMLLGSNPDIGYELVSGVNFSNTGVGGDLSWGDNDPSDFDMSVADDQANGVGAGSADGTIRFYSLSGAPIT